MFGHQNTLTGFHMILQEVSVARDVQTGRKALRRRQSLRLQAKREKAMPCNATFGAHRIVISPATGRDNNYGALYVHLKTRHSQTVHHRRPNTLPCSL